MSRAPEALVKDPVSDKDLFDAICVAAEKLKRHKRFGRLAIVLVKHSPDSRSARALRMRRDRGGLYVRTGRGGAQKKYLRDMAGGSTVIPDLQIVEFYEYS